MEEVRHYYNTYKKIYVSEYQMMVWLQTEWRYEDGKLYKLIDNSRPMTALHKRPCVITVHGFRVQESYAVWMFHGLFTPLDCEIDHWDRDTQNNSMENLRLATRQEQAVNRNSFKGSTSKYKGVYYRRRENKWGVEIQANNKRKYLGIFKSEDAAARAYNQAALELHGKWAVLNIIEGDT